MREKRSSPVTLHVVGGCPRTRAGQPRQSEQTQQENRLLLFLACWWLRNDKYGHRWRQFSGELRIVSRFSAGLRKFTCEKCTEREFTFCDTGQHLQGGTLQPHRALAHGVRKGRCDRLITAGCWSRTCCRNRRAWWHCSRCSGLLTLRIGGAGALLPDINTRGAARLHGRSNERSALVRPVHRIPAQRHQRVAGRTVGLQDVVHAGGQFG